MTRPEGSRSSGSVGTTRYAAAAVILLLVIATLYLYYNPSGKGNENTLTFPSLSSSTSRSSTSSSTTTPPPADDVAIASAVINNGTLGLHITNKGPGTTSSLTIISICTPRFLVCYDYRGMAGAYYHIVFVLPPKRTFLANLTGVCTMPVPGCRGYLPVANAKYYLGFKFAFSDGQTANAQVTVLANSTWSKHPTAITNITAPALKTFSKNLSGTFEVTVTLNSSLTGLCTKDCVGATTKLDGYLKPSNGFSGVLLTNSTVRCGGNSTYDCTLPITITVRFSTVLTGIVSGPYYAAVVRDTTDIEKPLGAPDFDTGPSTFALWIQGG